MNTDGYRFENVTAALAVNCQMNEIKSNADIEPCLSVVMPVFNEVATVVDVIKAVLAQRLVQQLVVVDDASTDGSREKLEATAKSDGRIKLARHPQENCSLKRIFFSQEEHPMLRQQPVRQLFQEMNAGFYLFFSIRSHS